MKLSKRVEALEAGRPTDPLPDLERPEHSAWRSEFFRRNMSDIQSLSIDQISAEDREEWASRIKDTTLEEYITVLIQVDRMF